MDSYITVKELGEYRFEDRKSVFIGYALPISSESDAIAFISSVKKKYPDARHWVYAYVIRENSTMRYSDDREPQGTAGMPILDIIRKKNITDIVVVVVRYFGGILLGTGGLVHAYSESALGAIEAAHIIKYEVYSTFEVNVTYADYQKISSLLASEKFFAEKTDYSDTVNIRGAVNSKIYSEFTEKLAEATGGRAQIAFIEEKFDFRE